MTKEDFIRKISSRKFLSLITALIIAIGTMFKVSDGTITQIIAIVGAFLAIISYMFAEAVVDSARVKKDV